MAEPVPAPDHQAWVDALANPSREVLLAYMENKCTTNDERADVWDSIRLSKPELYNPSVALDSIQGEPNRRRYFNWQCDMNIWEHYPLTRAQINRVATLLQTQRHLPEVMLLLLSHNPLRSWPDRDDVDLVIDLISKIESIAKSLYLLCEIVCRYTAQVPDGQQEPNLNHALQLARLVRSRYADEEARVKAIQIILMNWPLVTFESMLHVVENPQSRSRLSSIIDTHAAAYESRQLRITRNRPLPAAVADNPCPEGEKACILCEEKQRAVAVVPCGHLFGCRACTAKALQLKMQCSICNAIVTGTQTVFNV